MKKIILLGNGSFSTEVADLLEDSQDYRVTGFATNQNKSSFEPELIGLPVHWVEELIALKESHSMLGAVGTTRRLAFTRQVEELGGRFFCFVHPLARVSTRAELGAGVLISPGALISSYTAIGRHTLVNRAASIGHHCEIGHHCSIGPGVTIGGHCRIGSQVFFGIGAVVRNGVTIGNGAVVGVGAVVVGDVPAGCQVVGVPARVVKQNIEPL